ncbi:MAG: cyclic nucleotide-binding domain-containing protein [Myxococcota bacterium]
MLEAPPPMVFTLGFGELGVRYRAIWFIGSIERDRWSSQTQVASGIWHAMHRAGIRFSFHRRQLYSGDPQDEALLPAARPQPDRFTLFRSVRLFDALSDAEVESLAERAERRDFGPPERIVREGEEGESMFVIAGGHVEVTVGGEGGAQVHTAELGPGANVGSMSLLTGEPRSATVRALDEVVVYEIEKVAMQEVFEANPETLERIGRTVAEWAAENEQKLLDHRLSQQEAAQRAQSLIVAMVSRVRAFFAAAPRREAAPRGEGFDHRLGEPEHAAQLPDERDPSRAAAEERS